MKVDEGKGENVLVGVGGRLFVQVADGRGDHVGVCVTRSVWVGDGNGTVAVGDRGGSVGVVGATRVRVALGVGEAEGRGVAGKTPCCARSWYQAKRKAASPLRIWFMASTGNAAPRSLPFGLRETSAHCRLNRRSSQTGFRRSLDR